MTGWGTGNTGVTGKRLTCITDLETKAMRSLIGYSYCQEGKSLTKYSGRGDKYLYLGTKGSVLRETR